MTVDEFYAFTDMRPDEERWELIDGQLILNEPPYVIHQLILGNALMALSTRKKVNKASWEVLPGFGVRVSNIDRPQPDLFVIPSLQSVWANERDTSSVIAVLEVDSPSSSGRDLHWKRMAYTGLPSLSHYLAIIQDTVDVFVYARDNHFAEQRASIPGRHDRTALAWRFVVDGGDLPGHGPDGVTVGVRPCPDCSPADSPLSLRRRSAP